MKLDALPFVPRARRLPARGTAPRVIPFLTREYFARRAPQMAGPKEDVQTARSRPSPDLRLFFTSLTQPRQPHPLRRIVCWWAQGMDRFLGGLQTALLVYYTLLGLTAFPLFARAQWVGGIVMATVGSVFGWLLLCRWQQSLPQDSAHNGLARQPRSRRSPKWKLQGSESMSLGVSDKRD